MVVRASLRINILRLALSRACCVSLSNCSVSLWKMRFTSFMSPTSACEVMVVRLEIGGVFVDNFRGWLFGALMSLGLVAKGS